MSSSYISEGNVTLLGIARYACEHRAAGDRFCQQRESRSRGFCRATIRFIMEIEAEQDKLSDEFFASKKAWWQLREIEPWSHSAGEQSLSHAHVCCC
ncbi:hypothetical protein KC319_g27 [Hortaea werneckii]|nr:hypothetical protein KC319_g27 [Hortaea werneckii]